ncbi:AAA family ATPase [bacterium]|nr:AAA family ATPase [candidate division CSSED10-310 bacterium]
MAEKISVVIVDPDPKSSQQIKTILRDIPGLEIEGETTALVNSFNLVKKLKPLIVVLNLFPSEEQSLNVSKKITQNFPDTIMVATASKPTSQTIIKSLRAGAQEFLSQPFVKEDVIEAMKSIIQRAKQKTGESTVRGKIITVMGVKGGVGTTTIATNLATVMAKYLKKEVVFLDLDLKFGHSQLFFNIKPKYSILDLGETINTIEPKLLKDALSKHSSGTFLLAGTNQIEESEAIHANQIDQLLYLLKTIFEYIIIDIHRTFDEITIKALDEADILLTVSNSEIPAIYNTKRCLDLFKKMGYSNDKVQLILNRCSAASGMDFRQLEKTIGYPIRWKLPNLNYPKMLKSINEGNPISLMMPKAKVSLEFLEMATALLHDEESDLGNSTKKQTKNIFKKIIKHKGK